MHIYKKNIHTRKIMFFFHGVYTDLYVMIYIVSMFFVRFMFDEKTRQTICIWGTLLFYFGISSEWERTDDVVLMIIGKFGIFMMQIICVVWFFTFR